MKSLSVYMNGYLVGTLGMEPGGANLFTYHQSWLNTPQARPVSLSLPLRERSYDGEVVFNFFDNLLPDSREIRERIAARYHAESLRPFDLLYEIGRDCVGAVILQPPDEAIQDIQHIYSERLNEAQLDAILTGYLSTTRFRQQEIPDFRISIAGAQEKTALLRYQGDWQVPKGITPTTHIFKLPVGEIQGHSFTLDLRDSVENEWLSMLLARLYGFEVPDCEIVLTQNTKALAVRRFDRRFVDGERWIARLPQEDMCQALGVSSSKKYESDGGPGIEAIMRFLLGSDAAEQDRETFMRSHILFWLLAASDGHAKNYSVAILPGGGYRLTPLYDIMSCYPLIGGRGLAKQDIKMAMALTATGRGKKYEWSTIFPRHFIATAKKCGFSEERMVELLREFGEQTPRVLAEAARLLPKDFPQHISEAIFLGVSKAAKRLMV
ncbi:serine/threonine protein kinase [Pluralibacter gergoviae]|uniref:type II toxin-antitoxin system HipA family toxin n=1 Tax=Pluralibacter gergoviae TaxID=61647 RepID=UPI0006524280|nr:type II toxin-antitoxin system HipA family toxin [Pluralibacter gergoviae]KMK20073.1 serine/threonine protein kinase [Pluralibacter gergoviae]